MLGFNSVCMGVWMCAEEVAAVRLDVLRDLVHERGEVGVRIEGDKVWKGAHFREALEREA